MTPSRFPAWYLLAGLVTTATWTQLDAIGWLALVPLAGALAMERWPAFWDRPFTGSTWWAEARRRLFPGVPSPTALAIGVVIALPVLVHLGLTAGEEFPYGGDEGYHFSATRTFARHLMAAGPWLVALAAAGAAIRRVHRRYLVTLLVLALWALSTRFGPEMTFARYPAAFYFLSAPLNILFEVAGVRNPHVANHVMNTLSVPMWVFVLRPIVVRRWPDWPLLVAGLLVYFQPTVLTFVGGGGLEPWSLVLLLVALEAAFTLPAADGWVAVLVAGMAAWVKEPAILVVPLVWALAMVDWRRHVPALRPGAVAIGITAVLPFVVYYFVRQTLELPRFYAVVPVGELLSAGRARVWLDRIHLQFGDTGLVLLSLLALFAVAGMFLYRRDRQARATHAVLALGAAGLVIFFYVDVQGVPYTGYGRYLMFPYVVAVSAVLFGLRRLEARGRVALVVGAAVVAGVCQAQPLAKVLSLDLGPDYARNSLEWHRCLIRLPFRALASRIPDEPGGGSVREIRLVSIALDTLITRVAYPDIDKAYTITPDIQTPATIDCACRDASQAMIAAFEFRANFDRATREDPTVVAARQVCVAQAEQSCGAVAYARDPAGGVVGILGMSPVRPDEPDVRGR